MKRSATHKDDRGKRIHLGTSLDTEISLLTYKWDSRIMRQQMILYMIDPYIELFVCLFVYLVIMFNL